MHLNQLGMCSIQQARVTNTESCQSDQCAAGTAVTTAFTFPAALVIGLLKDVPGLAVWATAFSSNKESAIPCEARGLVTAALRCFYDLQEQQRSSHLLLHICIVNPFSQGQSACLQVPDCLCVIRQFRAQWRNRNNCSTPLVIIPDHMGCLIEAGCTAPCTHPISCVSIYFVPATQDQCLLQRSSRQCEGVVRRRPWLCEC